MPKHRRKKRWIQKAHLKKGALHRQLGVPRGEKIPYALLLKFKHAAGKLGKRVRAALNLRRLGKKKKKHRSRPVRRRKTKYQVRKKKHRSRPVRRRKTKYQVRMNRNQHQKKLMKVANRFPSATRFSWDDPRARTGDGIDFNHYHGPKIYMVHNRLLTKSQALNYGSTGTVPENRIPVLRGEPVLKDFIGPMWGGVWEGKPIIRYETPEDYEALSR